MLSTIRNGARNRSIEKTVTFRSAPRCAVSAAPSTRVVMPGISNGCGPPAPTAGRRRASSWGYGPADKSSVAGMDGGERTAMPSRSVAHAGRPGGCRGAGSVPRWDCRRFGVSRWSISPPPSFATRSPAAPGRWVAGHQTSESWVRDRTGLGLLTFSHVVDDLYQGSVPALIPFLGWPVPSCASRRGHLPYPLLRATIYRVA